MDILEDSGMSTYEEKNVPCSGMSGYLVFPELNLLQQVIVRSWWLMGLFSTGSIRLSEESVFLSPNIQYDNPIYEEEPPTISERLESLEKNMWALSPISAQVFSPSKPSNVSMMVLEFENSGTCSTPGREGTLSYEGSFAQTPGVSPSLAALPTSGSLSPFLQFQRKDPDLQMTLVKQSLAVINTATREELLQLKVSLFWSHGINDSLPSAKYDTYTSRSY
nr:uncharacterized protein LOC112294777 [Physcomitrium patens]|eukprot:XP_024401369.1 uncharacterized protein LOC112294777 [Physcomitrella patens]